MPTATREIFKDDSPLFQGTHKGGDSSSFLSDPGAMFRALGANPDLDLYVENTTQGTSGVLFGANNDLVSVTGDTISWNNGDIYKIYATSTKNSFIAGQWCDNSRGWKINPGDDINSDGWRREDEDLDGRNRAKVFGPGQPE